MDQPFFQHYLGMRNEYVDMTEIKRCLDREIFDKEEFEQALSWTKEHCKEGKDYNRVPMTEERKTDDWESDHHSCNQPEKSDYQNGDLPDESRWLSL